MPVLDIEALDRELLTEQSKSVIEAEKQCKIALSASWPRPVELYWHTGRNGRPTRIMLEPGKAVVQPLSKAQVWFGPFSVPHEYAVCTDDKRKEYLKSFWDMEKSRYLNRYDYPRASYKEMRPTGPHRSPDVSVTIIEADGTQSDPIRLYELYKIGEFDPLHESFGKRETSEELVDKYERIIQQMKEDALRRDAQLAQVTGMVQGLAASKKGV